MTEPLFVDVHIIQSLPPSNVNRDDAGSPKQAVYGGARRARVSSQSWKRATRKAFPALLSGEHLASRTKRIFKLLADRLAARTGLDQEAALRLSVALLAGLKITPDKKKPTDTSYLLFFGYSQLDAIVALVADRATELAALDDTALAAAVKDYDVEKQLGTGHPVDVALFGRMVADLPALNVDAATQVAHVISTHAVAPEFDYYTAVDDENDEDESGAGMIGTIEFNSATLYRYATVGVHQLLENLGGDLDEAVRALGAFVAAFARSVPSGHQNAFAHQTVPAFVSVMLRDDQPVNLVSAFERPVSSTDGLLAASVTKLAAETTRCAEQWGLAPRAVTSVYDDTDEQLVKNADRLTKAFGPPVAFDQLVDGLGTTVRTRLSESDR